MENNKKALWEKCSSAVKAYLETDSRCNAEKLNDILEKQKEIEVFHGRSFDKQSVLQQDLPNFLELVSKVISEQAASHRKATREAFLGYFSRIIVTLIWLWTVNIIHTTSPTGTTESEDLHYPNSNEECLAIMQDALNFCLMNKDNLTLATELNRLIQSWDIVLTQRHDYAPVHCIILMSGSNESWMPIPQFEKDIQLTIIRLTPSKSMKRKTIIALHELGHSVGCRQRVARADSFLRLSAMSFCDCVYRKSWAIILQMANESFIPNRSSDRFYTPDLRHEMNESKRLIEQIAESLICNLSKSIDLNVSIDKLYLHSLRFLILKVVKECTQKGTKIDQIIMKSNCCDQVKNAIKQAIISVLKEANNNSDHNIETWDFVTRVIMLYEEIAADVFMVRTLGMKSAGKYVRVALDQARINYEARNSGIDRSLQDREFWQVALSDVLRIRICAILYVLLDGKSSKHILFTSPFNKNRVICKRIQRQYELFLRVDQIIDDELIHPSPNFYQEFLSQDIWNPIRFFAAYAVNIHQDNLYKTVCGSWPLSQTTKRNSWNNKDNNEQQVNPNDITYIGECVNTMRNCYSLFYRLVHKFIR